MTSSLIIAALCVLFNAPDTLAPQARKPHAPVTMTWGDRPSIRVGTAARVDLRVNLQAEARDMEARQPDVSRVAWARKRAGVDGVLMHVLGFQIEAEIGDAQPWRDVYVNYQQFEALQVQAGRFKVPFSREQTTSAANLDFVYRSRAAATLAPGRDRGLMIHGRVAQDHVTYEAGIFVHDGDNARADDAAHVSGGSTLAARVSARPFRSTTSIARMLDVGAAATTSDVPEGLSPLKGETALGEDYYEPELWVRGTRRRVGLELRWRPGPCSVKAEYLRLTTERLRQSVEETDLSPLLADGWYLSGTWIVTGEHKADGPDRPRRPLFAGGFGAIEVAGRFEALEFSSSGTIGLPSTSPRADVILGNRLEVLTVGVNWYPMRWVKVQVNAIRETLRESVEGPLPGGLPFWSHVVRLQFAW